MDLDESEEEEDDDEEEDEDDGRAQDQDFSPLMDIVLNKRSGRLFCESKLEKFMGKAAQLGALQESLIVDGHLYNTLRQLGRCKRDFPVFRLPSSFPALDQANAVIFGTKEEHDNNGVDMEMTED